MEDTKEIISSLKEVLSMKRYEHTIRVKETAIELSSHYDVSIDKVEAAALLHDYAKCFSVETLKSSIDKYALPSTLLTYHHELWHAPVAAELVKEKFHILDEDILNAIRYHTTGRVGMSPLEKIIFIADYIEPARNFPGIEDVRKLAIQNLDVAVRKALQNTILFLIGKDSTIHPDSFMAYNDLTMNMKGR